MSIFIKNKSVLFSFYHIEKCAGTSLRFELFDYFSNFLDKKYIFIPEKNEIGNINLTSKNILEISKLGDKFIEFINEKIVILSHISYNDPVFCFDPIFKITCIRHPINRVISHYNYFDKNNYQNREFDKLSNSELNSWFQTKGNLTIFRLTNTSNDLKKAKQNLLKMDHVILFENYKHDILILGEKLYNCFGYKFDYKNIVKNNSVKNNYKYSNAFLEKIIYLLKDELELYYFYKNIKTNFQMCKSVN